MKKMKMMMVSVVIPCLCGWSLLVQAYAASKENGTSEGHGVKCCSSCTPAPSPGGGG